MSEADVTRARPAGRPPFGSSAPPAAPPNSVAALFEPPTAPDEIGRIGDYRILKLLGEGGMGSVYLAEDVKLGRPVALKFLLPEVAASEYGKVRFLREARAAARIRHENVIVIYQVDEARGVPFIAMERLKGVTLEDWLRKKGVLPLPQAVRIVREMLAGLSAAHDAGLVHRDIKPANVWLEAPKGKVRLLDFGLAVRPDGDERVTHTGVVMGTPSYMSPEQAHGKSVDLRSDLFSVGVVLYRLCTGKMPFTGGSPIEVLVKVCSEEPPAPREVNPDVPEWLDALVMRLMSKDPDGRPASADEAIKALATPLTAGTAPSAPVIDVPQGTSGANALTPTVVPSRTAKAVTVPAEPAAPPAEAPSTAFDFVDETETDEEDEAEVRRRRRRRDKARERDEERDDEARRFRADMCGVGSVLLGLAALGALFLIAFNKHALALPLAAGGIACGFFARGQTRVNAMVLNVLALAGAFGVLAFAPQIRETFAISPPGSAKAAPASGNDQQGGTARPAVVPAIPAGPPGTLEVEFEAADRQAGFALFVGGRSYPIDRTKAVTVVSVASGPQALEVRYEDGTEAYATSVTVRPQEQGKTAVRIPKLDSPDALGTLEIQYQRMAAMHWEGIEMFVDDKLVRTGPPTNDATHSLSLSRGNHTLRYVRNGTTLHQATVAVQRPGAGPTVYKVNLLDQLVVQVTINNPVPVQQGIEAYVEVDGKLAKEWPAGTRTITVEASPGTHVITVKARKPFNRTVLTLSVTLTAGMPFTLDIPGGPPG